MKNDETSVRPLFNKLVLIGVGLIGGSFALALKKAGMVRHIVGLDRHQAALEEAQQLGIIDSHTFDLASALEGADLIVIATPVAQTTKILEAIYPLLQAHTVVTDVGSTKTDVVIAARQALKEKVAQFVPAHPIAGREKNGPSAALSDLYVGKKTVITRLPENTDHLLSRVAQAWQACGAIIHYLTPQEHDQVFASVSHLPHLLAYTLVADIAAKPHADRLFQYAASGFRDFTRIAGSSPEMWRDISIANREALLQELDSYTEQLAHLRQYLQNADAAALEHVYRRAQEARVNWITAIEAAEAQSRYGGD
ncbi:prephenate dehydrogenase/arogenate dehydrogenase family protein [Undibacterium cyanobacteriorum]|uniref:Prephenate dehydrogenase/arogenate dehydrogenase family protein n=1 Tax=Undibacterium cyanobacteriorum TaxID=3073561 RepID=A0ABY9RFG9_9BURK|nr:prephenate dehydrogenase/arogenate dehydrogenase family protein [Undibacterium sp. 20NA77.5]WMW79389.1 prephenate dehydrogenase/arogenate dehydrogenase family protein [Undibacterium sp. 20NA77.5]